MGLFPQKEYFNISKTWLTYRHKQSEISWHQDYVFFISINRLHIILMMLISDILSKRGIHK